MDEWEDEQEGLEWRRLQEKLTETEAALANFEEAHRKVKAPFKHKAGEPCGCPYCTHDADALAIHAAEQELKWMDAQGMLRSLQSRVAELEALKDLPKVVGVLVCKWCKKEFTSESVFIDHLQMHLDAASPEQPESTSHFREDNYWAAWDKWDKTEKQMVREMFKSNTEEGVEKIRKAMAEYGHLQQPPEKRAEVQKVLRNAIKDFDNEINF